MLFRSGKLDAGNHDLTIETVEMDANRTYTLKYFLVTPSPPPKQKNVGAIVGGVLGGIALMVLLLVGYIVWKRRKTSQRNSRRIRHMVYPDPMNHGNWSKCASCLVLWKNLDWLIWLKKIKEHTHGIHTWILTRSTRLIICQGNFQRIQGLKEYHGFPLVFCQPVHGVPSRMVLVPTGRVTAGPVQYEI